MEKERFEYFCPNCDCDLSGARETITRMERARLIKNIEAMIGDSKWFNHSVDDALKVLIKTINQ